MNLGLLSAAGLYKVAANVDLQFQGWYHTNIIYTGILLELHILQELNNTTERYSESTSI